MSTILVADDTPAITEALQIQLEMAGYVVETTNNGGNVIHMLQARPPDLLILDIRLSGYDGADLCKCIKQQERLRQIPLLLISANHDTPKIAQEAGADGYILKPFQMRNLLSIVEAAIKEKRRC